MSFDAVGRTESRDDGIKTVGLAERFEVGIRLQVVDIGESQIHRDLEEVTRRRELGERGRLDGQELYCRICRHLVPRGGHV